MSSRSHLLRNSLFRSEMRGVDVPGNVYVHIAGIDVVRVAEDTFYVLEDNLRTPSGVSYMLQNRAAMMRLFPQVFAKARVAPGSITSPRSYSAPCVRWHRPAARANRQWWCPGLPHMKDALNARIKHREWFRPFAPAILADAQNDYFEHDHPSPYMLHVYKIRADKRQSLCAVNHVDDTGRLQTVTRDENPLYYDLIHTFGRKTGIPLILNTSFNENEPIVCTPRKPSIASSAQEWTCSPSAHSWRAKPRTDASAPTRTGGCHGIDRCKSSQGQLVARHSGAGLGPGRAVRMPRISARLFANCSAPAGRKRRVGAGGEVSPRVVEKADGAVPAWLSPSARRLSCARGSR